MKFPRLSSGARQTFTQASGCGKKVQPSQALKIRKKKRCPPWPRGRVAWPCVKKWKRCQRLTDGETLVFKTIMNTQVIGRTKMQIMKSRRVTLLRKKFSHEEGYPGSWGRWSEQALATAVTILLMKRSLSKSTFLGSYHRKSSSSLHMLLQPYLW